MKKRNLKSGWQIITVRRAVLFTAVLTLVFGGLSIYKQSEAAVPASGTLTDTVGNNAAWLGDRVLPATAANGEPSCTTGNNMAANCDVYTLTVPAGTWTGKVIRIRFDWSIAANDYDMVVRRETNGIAGMQGDGVGVNPDPTVQPLDTIVATSGQGTTTFEEVVISPPDSGETYYIRAIYFAVAPDPADPVPGRLGQYSGSAVVEANATTAPPAGTCTIPTFDNYQPPVGYSRRDNAGEPSIGINWNTDNVMTMSRLQANRTTFNDSTSPADPVNGVTFFPRSITLAPTGFDPIGFTDPVTGRSIFGELEVVGGSTNAVLSDDDLATISNVVQTGGATQGVDHQTIAGGPPNPNAPSERQPTGSYPHLWYYASQSIATATVATSLDGGFTYLPAVPAYNLTQCGGLHGHLKVAPNDGTVYLPNKGCNGKQGFAVSEDNGLTWAVKTVPTSTSGNTDPSVGIGAGGRVYFAYSSGDNHPHVAVSNNKGQTFQNDFDLALAVAPNLTASVFMHVVAGDNDRAAVFFLATDSTNPGDPVGDDTGTVFAGTWFPYMATTCNGGQSWSVVRADNIPFSGQPNPVQQGVVCTNGTTCPAGTRNLLDFNEMAVDSRGRIVSVYADGCGPEHPCSSILDNSGTKAENQGIARLTIIRQRGGSRLFSAFDPGGPAAPTLSPPVFVEEQQRGYKLSWATPDDNGSPLTSYRIYRGQAKHGEKLISEVNPGVHNFTDTVKMKQLIRRKGNYYYRVTAVNEYGESPRNVKAFPVSE